MRKITHLFGDLLLLAVSLLCILPFLYMILMSLKSTINVYDFSLSLSDLTLEQYRKIFSDAAFLHYFRNSVIVALAGVALTLFTSCTAGFAFAKLKFKGNDKIFLLLILTMLVPSQIILVPLYIVVRGLGWVNTFKALILPLPGAFGVFIMRQAILGIPNELIESARIDGASDFKILRTIVLPLVKSAMLTLSIFTFLGAWNNFTWPLIITTKESMRTLPLALTTMKTQYDSDVGLTMACAAVTFLPPFIFYLFLQSKFEEGVALNGMKG
ncbi:MAG TPA: carbohydrate ABC transporter permease [Lachnospiraceae bacterium]|nr:carbohydrate ABC transporter permease [Lachnospiraceae bacterium]